MFLKMFIGNKFIEKIKVYLCTVKIMRLFINGKIGVFKDGFICILILCQILKEKNVIVGRNPVFALNIAKFENRYFFTFPACFILGSKCISVARYFRLCRITLAVILCFISADIYFMSFGCFYFNSKGKCISAEISVTGIQAITVNGKNKFKHFTHIPILPFIKYVHTLCNNI